MEIPFGFIWTIAGGFLLQLVTQLVGYGMLKQEVKDMKNTMNHWQEKGMPCCTLHTELEKRVRQIEINEGKS